MKSKIENLKEENKKLKEQLEGYKDFLEHVSLELLSPIARNVMQTIHENMDLRTKEDIENYAKENHYYEEIMYQICKDIIRWQKEEEERLKHKEEPEIYLYT